MRALKRIIKDSRVHKTLYFHERGDSLSSEAGSKHAHTGRKEEGEGEGDDSNLISVSSLSPSSVSSSMFRFICKRLVSQTSSGNGNLTTQQPLHFLQNPSSHFTTIKFLSTSTDPITSFMISYFMYSCGLSSEQAITASKQIQFQTTDRPDSVLTLFRNNGFTKPYIIKLITRRPEILLADAEKTLKPKFDFFNSIGLSGLDLAKVLSTDSNILRYNLEKHIIPSYVFLKSIVETDDNIISILKRSTWILLREPGKQMAPNISILRDISVPEKNITTLLVTQPRAFLQKTERFKEIVEDIKGKGINPLKFTFVLAIHALTSMSKSTLEYKFDVYRRWGWSEDEIGMAFRKQPCCMMVSEKKIMSTMDFLVNQMGYNSSLLAKYPTVLNLSLEKRIKPRCLVFQILVSKGLVVKDHLISTTLIMVEKDFLRKYVTKYVKKVPELLNVYNQMAPNISISRNNSVPELNTSAPLVTKCKWTPESKFDVYRRWGWSEKEIQMATKKQPCCLMASEKKIMRVMDFLVNQMGYDSKLIAKYPIILHFSLEKRIIPRCSVFQVLVSRGLIAKNCFLSTPLMLVEEEFLRKYVTKYAEKVPELLEVYQAKLNSLEMANSS